MNIYILIDRAVHFFNEKSKVMLVAHWTDHYGHCAEDLHFGLMRAKREGKKVFFILAWPQMLWGRSNKTNRELCDVRSPYRFLGHHHPLSLCLGFIVAVTYGLLLAGYLLWRKILRGVGLAWPGLNIPPFYPWCYSPTFGRSNIYKPRGRDKFIWDAVSYEAEQWRKVREEPLGVYLALEKHQRAEKRRIEMGIPLKDQFVCLHVRESGFHADAQFVNSRNASINSYIPALKRITERGMWVVRMGDPSMKPLPPIEGVIDYSHAPFRSPLMDIYLKSQCEFFFGSTSGAISAARLFGKREVVANLAGWTFSFPLRHGDLAITKHIFSKKHNRYLSLREVLEEPFECQSNPLGADYRTQENTPDEIADLLEDFLITPPEAPRSELQNYFNEAHKKALRRWLDEITLLHPSSMVSDLDKYRAVALGYSSCGAIAAGFLNKNWHRSSRQDGGLPADMAGASLHS